MVSVEDIVLVVDSFSCSPGDDFFLLVWLRGDFLVNRRIRPNPVPLGMSVVARKRKGEKEGKEKRMQQLDLEGKKQKLCAVRMCCVCVMWCARTETPPSSFFLGYYTDHTIITNSFQDIKNFYAAIMIQ